MVGGETVEVGGHGMRVMDLNCSHFFFEFQS